MDETPRTDLERFYVDRIHALEDALSAAQRRVIELELRILQYEAAANEANLQEKL